MKDPKKIYYAFKPQMVLETCEGITDPLAQAFFAFLYLTGARLNEATDFSINRMDAHDDYVEVELKTLKTRSQAKKWRKIIIPIGGNAKCNENKLWGIVKSYLGSLDMTPFFKPFRKWPSKWGMGAYLSRHVVMMAERKERQDNGEYKDVYVEKPFHPHFLRHCRATHLAEYYNLYPTILAQFFGWTDQNMTNKYTATAEIKRALIKSR